MAVKKKNPRRRAAAGIDAGGFTVVLEDLRAQFGAFGEALQGLREHMDARFERVDARFEGVDARFERVDARFGGLEHEMGLVKSVLLDHGRQLREIRRSVETIETKLDAKVDRSEVALIVEGVLSKRR